MSEHSDYIETVISESHSAYDVDMPEPLDNWSLEDFEDVIQPGEK
jgi:hypothetical protein